MGGVYITQKRIGVFYRIIGYIWIKLPEIDKRIRDSLKNLAIAQGLRLPVLLPAKELEQVRQMSKMDPVYFEELYMKMMLEEHDKYIELFKSAINSPHTAVTSFAHRFLPFLETNRETALKVAGSLRGDGEFNLFKKGYFTQYFTSVTPDL